MGGLFFILGIYLIIFLIDLRGGFVLVGIGVAIMASTSEEFREKFYAFALSVLEGLWKTITRS